MKRKVMNGLYKMKWVALVLSVFSVGQSAPVDNCESLLKPITISYTEMLGKWLYVGGTSDLPGSRSLIHLLTSAWVECRPTSQSNVLELIQAQRTFGKCSTIKYNVTFENSTLLIEQPFYLKEVYLSAECSECMTAYEIVISGKDTFTSLLLFCKNSTVPAPALEMFKKQAKCLKMPLPIMVDQNNEMCPEDPAPLEGLATLNSYMEAKIEHHVIRLLDTMFDLFVN